MAGTVKITFIGDSSNLRKNLKEVAKQADDSNGAFGRLGGGASKLGGFLKAVTPSAQTVALGFGAMTIAAGAFGKKSLDAYNQSLEAQTKLSTNLLNVKGNTEANVKSIEKMASALQKKGVIEDDAIIAGASQLATFNLQGKTIEKLTPKIADMAAQLHGSNATGEDMVRINNLIGKVMTGNVGALSKYGVSLSDNQKKQLKNGNEAQRAALLVEVLGQNYGKINEELAKTPEGQLTILRNRFGDLQESIGNVLVKALVPVMSFTMDKVIPAFESLWNAAVMLVTGDFKGGIFGLSEDSPFIGAILNFRNALFDVWETIKLFATGDFQKNLFGFQEDSDFVGAILNIRKAMIDSWPVIKNIASAIGEGLAAAFRGIGTAIKASRPIIQDIIDKFREWGPSISAFFKDAWESVLKPVFESIVKLVLLVKRIFEDAWPAIQVILKVAGVVIGAALYGIYQVIKHVLVPAITWMVDNMSRSWSVITTVIEAAWKIIKPIWDLIWSYITNIMIPTWKIIFAVVKKVWEDISSKISWAWNNIIKPIWDLIWGYITNFLVPIWKLMWDAAKKAWEGISNSIQTAWDFVKPIIEKVKTWLTDYVITPLQNTWDKAKEAWEGISSAISTAKDAIVEIFKDLWAKIPQGIKELFGLDNNTGKPLNVGIAEAKTPELRQQLKGGQLRKALGGPVKAGIPYTVGEGGGPETFVPSTDGHIMNARQTRSMGGTYNVNVYTSQVALDEEGLARVLRRHESLYAA